MNVQILQKIRRLNNFYLKLNSVRNAHSKAEASELGTFVRQLPQLSQSSAGMTVVSVENYNPISQIAIAIKAGSRYESPENVGVTHCLRNAASLSTQGQTAFTLTKNIEIKGAKLDVTATREHLIYTFACQRDYIDYGVEVLSEIIGKTAFKTWEITESFSRMHLDLAIHAKNPDTVLLEALHKAAFKGGLSNSLYSPQFMIGKHDSEMLHSFVSESFTNPRMSVVGLGTLHEQLQESIDKCFEMPNHVLQSDASKFVPREVRLESNLPFVHSAIVAEGASLTNNKDLLSLGLLQSILGSGTPVCNKLSKLGAAAAKKTNNPFHVSSLNINYSDSGLFGVYICANPNEMNDVVRAVVTEMRAVAKNISESDLTVAKHKLKTKLLLERETAKSTLVLMAQEVSQFGQLKSVATVEKAIDDIKLSDVTAIAAKVMKAKPAMAAVGRLHATPFVDELL